MNSRLESAKHRHTSAYVVLTRMAPQLHKPAPPQQRGLLPFLRMTEARYTPMPRHFTPRIYILRLKRWFKQLHQRMFMSAIAERVPESQSVRLPETQSLRQQAKQASPYTTAVMPSIAERPTLVLPTVSPYETQFLPTVKQAEEPSHTDRTS